MKNTTFTYYSNNRVLSVTCEYFEGLPARFTSAEDRYYPEESSEFYIKDVFDEETLEKVAFTEEELVEVEQYFWNKLEEKV